MALGGGPAADAPVGVDVLAATAEPRVALKALRKEITAAEKELARLVKDGQSIQSQSANLKKLETQYKYVSGMDQRAREMMSRSKQAIALGKLANAAMTAQVVGNLVRGGIDAQSTFTLAAMAMQHEKAITRAFGAQGLRFARALAPAMPLIGAGLSSLMEGVKEKKRLEDDMSAIGAAFRQGRMSKAQELWAQEVLTDTWFGDPKGTIAAGEQVGKAMSKLPPHKLREALSKVHVSETYMAADTRPGAYGSYRIETRTQGIDQAAFMAEANAMEMKEQGRLGRLLDKGEYAGVLVTAMAEYGRKRKLPQDLLEKFAQQLEQSDANQIELDLGHRKKFMDDLLKNKEAAILRARHIPARMEY